MQVLVQMYHLYETSDFPVRTFVVLLIPLYH